MNICNEQNCTGCGLCVSLCPKGTVSLQCKADGRTVAVIGEDNCINCGLCEKACPQNNVFNGQLPIEAYSAWMMDAEKKKYSASGGIGYALAERWITNGGVVFGAAWDDNHVKHIAIQNVADIGRIAGSKYVQSDTTDAFREIKDYLKSRTKILFFGTPCQVDAVKRLVNHKNENLVTVDLVCHGVPPMAYLREYLKERLDNISYLSNRDQSKGKGLKLCNRNGEAVFISEQKDSWMMGFKQNFTLRENCYQCRYSRPERCGDITIGDFWGLNRRQMPSTCPKYVSLVLINNSSGKSLWESVLGMVEIHRRAIAEAINGNDNLQHPTPVPEQRKSFLQYLESEGDFTVALKRTLSLEKKQSKSRVILKKGKKFIGCVLRRFACLFLPKEAIASEKSVGIVTIGRKYLLMNYGSLMQHFALRNFLNDKGYLPWRCETEGELNCLIVESWITRVKHLLHSSKAEPWLNLQFARFMKKHFGGVLEPQQKRCKKYVVGSDQVWGRPTQRKALADLKDVIKVSYAVSADWKFVECDEGWQYYMSEVLADYHTISVREAKGVGFLQAVCPNKTIAQTIDPTFLLPQSVYDSIIPPEPLFDRPTLFCYFVNIFDASYIDFRELERVANEQKMALVITGIQGAEDFIPSQYYRRLSPEDWLRAYRDASKIVTNSFHGTVFALIYNKPFVVLEQFEKEGRCQNLRLVELAESFNFKNRIVSTEWLIQLDELLSQSIDWETVNTRIQEKTAFSKKWLLEALSEESKMCHVSFRRKLVMNDLNNLAVQSIADIYDSLLQNGASSVIYYNGCQLHANFQSLDYSDIEQYFKAGEKKSLVNIPELRTFFSDTVHGCNRVQHMFSVYLLGVYVYDHIDAIKIAFNRFIIKIWENTYYSREDQTQQEAKELRRDFLYLWYLTVLFHDMGYAYESLGNSDDSHYSFVSSRKSMNSKENLDCHEPILGIPENLRLSAKEYFYQRRVNLFFNENRCTDHGFAAGLILYKELKELHDQEKTSVQKSPIGQSYLHFSPKIFQWYNIPSAWSIICHNIWLAEAGTEREGKYEQLGLEKLVYSRGNSPIKYDLHPLLFLLDFIDTIDFFKRLKYNHDYLKKITCQCSSNSLTFLFEVAQDQQSQFVDLSKVDILQKIKKDISFLESDNFTASVGESCITFSFA